MRGMDMAYNQAEINYDQTIRDLVETIGQYMEGVQQQLDDDLFPQVRLRQPDGFNVTTIVEAALLRLAKDIRQGEPIRDLDRYVEQYINIDKSQDKRVHLSEISLDSINTAAEAFKDRIAAKLLYPAPKRQINRRLLITIALQYAVDSIK